MRADPTSTPVALRAVRFDEVAQVLRLIRRAVDVGCRNHYDRRQLEAVYASYAGTLFVDTLGPVETIAATVGGRIAGVAQLDPVEGRLRALFVDGDCQGRGLGRALMAEIEARAVRHGCVRLHGAMSLNAVPFYAATGFRACHGPQRLVTARTLVPIVRMEKALAR
ncbi:MAG: GNAT family N-acetyltransferase [Myxococcales bacterium]